NNNHELHRLFHKDILPIIGSIEVRHLKELDILNVLRNQKRRGVVKLVLTTLADIRQLLSWAEKRQPWRRLLIDGNPALLIDKNTLTPVGYQSERDRVLTAGEIYELAQIFNQQERDCGNFFDTSVIRQPLVRRSQLALWICLGTLCRIG